MTKTRVMLVDDHGVLRAGLKALLDGQTDMEVVAEAGTAAAALPLAQERRPDVLVLDLTLPGGGSTQLAKSLSREGGPKILMLTMHDDPAYVRAALAAGATGYIVKTVREQELLAAIRAVRSGQVVVNLDDVVKTAAVFGVAGATGANGHLARAARLSDREAAVLRLLGRGHSNQEVAEALELSPKTVATYRARIAEKLGLKTTADFVKYATDNGLLEPGSG